MKGQVIQFRRGRKTYKPRHFIIAVEGSEDKKKAASLVGKIVKWKSPAGKVISGIVKASHGNKGNVRVIFEKGLPGQAVNESVEVL